MFITYFIVLTLSIVFMLIHWPGAHLLLLLSCVFPLIDILVQSIRTKKDKKLRMLSSTGLLGISIFLVFLTLIWPGARILFFGAIAMTIPYFIVFFTSKAKMNLRFFLMVFITLFAVLNFSMKESTRREFYMAEDPFKDRVPSFLLRDLAFNYYNEGNPEKAEILLSKALRRLKEQEEYIADNKMSGFEEKIVSDNIKGISQDLEAVKNKNWERKAYLIYEDFYFPE